MRIGVLVAIVLVPVFSWAQDAVETARREANKAIGALDWHTRTQTEPTYKTISKLIRDMGKEPKRADSIRSVSSLETPDDQLFNLKRHFRWANNLDPYAWKDKRKQTQVSKFRYMLLARMNWLRDLLKAQITLRKLRAALPETNAAAAGIRDIEAMEKRFLKAYKWHSYKAPLITTEDYEAFLGKATRLKKALAVLAGKGSTAAKLKIKCLAIIGGAVNPPLCVVSKKVVYKPADGHIADAIWTLASTNRTPVKIGLEIPIQARLSFANGSPVGRGKITYRGTKIDKTAKLRFHWDVSRKYRAVLKPVGASGAGAILTIKPQ